MATSDSHPQPGNAPSSTFTGAGDLQPLVTKLYKIARDLEELEGLVAQKRRDFLRQFSSVTLLTREAAAERLSMSTSQVDRAVRKGSLQRINIDRKPRFAVSDIQAFIDSRRSNGSRRRSKTNKTDGAPSRHDQPKS